MARYVDRNKLPQFTYFNHHLGDVNKSEPWYNYTDGGDLIIYTPEEGKKIYEGIVDKTEEMTHDIVALRNQSTSPVHIFEKYGTKSEDLYPAINHLIRVMFKEKDTQELWFKKLAECIEKIKTLCDMNITSMMSSTRYIVRFIELIRSIILLSSILITTQGFESNYCGLSYPKMLFVKDSLYKKIKKNIDALNLDYSLIKSHLDMPYVININGDSAEKKMTFVLYESTDREGYESVNIDIVNPKIGLSRFVYGSSSKGQGVIAGLECYPRHDFECQLSKKSCYYYTKSKETNCVCNTLKVVASILYCYQEYQRKVQVQEEVRSQSASSSSDAVPFVKPFIPDGMMRLYDIKYSKEELKRFNKFASFSSTRSPYPSTEKTPHVRRSTWRYNKKTGLRDIHVRACIIHEDRYKGFASAERLVE